MDIAHRRPAARHAVVAPLTVVALLVVLATLGPSPGCAPGPGSGSGTPDTAGHPVTIRIAGSDTMGPLLRRWAEVYMRMHADVAIYVDGGGSRRGIDRLIEGDVDLAAASRAMRANEVKRLHDRHGFLGLSVLTAKDALSVYLNRANPVDNLTIAQLRDIFTGTAHHWSAVGGNDIPILIIHRNPNSGTHFFFRQRVLEAAPYGGESRTVSTTQAVVDAVAAEPGAVGYGGLVFGESVRHCRIEGVEPTLDNVRNGTYPLARYLYLYAAGPLDGAIRQYVDWILSDEGQRTVAEVGYIPLWDPGTAP
ncbi:MAG: phosphate ABC transporter substrate-binding protein [Candidatus Eiseniibacteriota bacterium]